MEEVAIKKTKLLLSLDVDVGDFNVEAGHNCSSCGFMLTEDMCTIMDNLPKFADRMSEDTKMALIYIAGYIVRKDYIEDTFKYHQKYGAFVNDLNRGGLTIPGDSACQWSLSCYVMFREVANYTCRKSLCNILMIISEFYGFNMERKRGMIMSNILFNNHSHLYTPRSSKDILFNNHSHHSLYTPRSSKDICISTIFKTFYLIIILNCILHDLLKTFYLIIILICILHDLLKTFYLIIILICILHDLLKTFYLIIILICILHDLLKTFYLIIILICILHDLLNTFCLIIILICILHDLLKTFCLIIILICILHDLLKTFCLIIILICILHDLLKTFCLIIILISILHDLLKTFCLIIILICILHDLLKKGSRRF